MLTLVESVSIHSLISSFLFLLAHTLIQFSGFELE